MCSSQDSLEEKASPGSFVIHGRHDVLTVAIGQPKHPGSVRAAGASVTIKQYFGSASRTSFIAPEYVVEKSAHFVQSYEQVITKVT